MIALENISLNLDNFRLDRISLNAATGEYLVILGPSGAGKTMLLEIIAGIRMTDEGTVRIGSRDMTGVPPERRGTALVYQDYSLFPHLTVAENIAYGMTRQHADRESIIRQVDALLYGFRISALRDRYPGSLSGGEQQRVALARALATQPSVLLLDEPFASLDPQTRDECIRVMQDLRDTRSVTIVQVSHSRDEAYALADRAVILFNGRIAQSGTMDEIFRHPRCRTVAQFVGLENIHSGQVLSNGAGYSQITFGNETIRVAGVFPPGSRISIGIPADTISIHLSEVVPADPGQNIVRCRTRRVTFGRDTVRFELDGPVPLISVLHRTGVTGEIGEPQQEVYALFRDSDIQILAED